NLRPSSEDSSGPEDEGHEDIECPMGNRPLCSIPLNPYDVFMEFIAPTPKHRVTREEPKHPNERDFCNADTQPSYCSSFPSGHAFTLCPLAGEYEREGVTKPRIWQYVAPQTDLLGPWLWDLIPVGEDGSAEVTVTVPDAVTEWKVGMFCTAPVGLGLAPTATLMAYKAFVLELALPHAVTCGKAFAVAATIFNYLQQCLRVQVMLEDSEDLEVLESADNTDGGCVSGYEARTFRWDVRAISLRKVNVTVTAQALHSKELCGTEVPVVPAQGHTEAVTKLLVVKVSQG
ncbi:A2MG protein, partial [Penelope pileata]|nr:A2MG protein [Penelope pileata]